MEKIPIEMFYVAIAAFGGLTRYLQSYLQEGRFAMRHLIAHVVVSSFSGFMYYQFANNVANITDGMAAVLAGVGGWMGVSALDFIEYLLKKRLGK